MENMSNKKLSSVLKMIVLVIDLGYKDDKQFIKYAKQVSKFVPVTIEEIEEVAILLGLIQEKDNV